MSVHPLRRVRYAPLLLAALFYPSAALSEESVTVDQIRSAFANQEVSVSAEEAQSIKADVERALAVSCESRSVGGNSKVGFEAVQMGQRLNLNTKNDPSLAVRITKAIDSLSCSKSVLPRDPNRPSYPGWEKYFEETIALTNNEDFVGLVSEKGFSPVRISWEDIGRNENSAWGDRISDVGIWVRKTEHDLSSAKLALSVRRDSNFRDKVLVVPIESIKVHRKQGGETKEVGLKERLAALGLSSVSHDRNVIVSNQFAIVPVPEWSQAPQAPDREESAGKMLVRRREAARTEFNFSIYPYGSTNYVITDVIEGSSEAVVGPGAHQLLYYNADGEKAPFTASRAEEREDLTKLESDLKAQGMDVDVQRYYLIQVPLKKGATGITLSNMGTPPVRQGWPNVVYSPWSQGADMMVAPMAESSMAKSESVVMEGSRRANKLGFSKVAIGHGEPEGSYNGGSGYEHNRADEPIRVTVVYFVTPVGKVSREDMENFTRAFEQWDTKAIWGGSFVTKETEKF